METERAYGVKATLNIGSRNDVWTKNDR